MLLTLKHNIIVNDGKQGVFRKSGENVEVRDSDAAILLINNLAEKFCRKESREK